MLQWRVLKKGLGDEAYVVLHSARLLAVELAHLPGMILGAHVGL
jgi:hypothetical protein